MTQELENVIPISKAVQNRKNDANLGELSEAVLRKVLEEVITPKFSRLETSINRMASQFEAIRNGEAEDAALRVTTDLSDTDIALASIEMYPEDYYKYSCGELSDKLNVRPHDVTAMIKLYGLRDNPQYYRKLSSGKKSHIIKWSDNAYWKLREVLDSCNYIPKVKK